MPIEMQSHWTSKQDGQLAECQDCAMHGEAPVTSTAMLRRYRAAVSDGATGGYDSQLWARLLVQGFHQDGDGIIDDEAAFLTWTRRRQREWVDQRPTAFKSLFHEEGWHRGSYATFVGLEIVERLDSSAISWHAVAVGDACLFHLRAGELIAQLPELASSSFGSTPDLVYTDDARLRRAVDGRRTSCGTFELGDVLLLATDALAQWAVGVHAAARSPWRALCTLDERGFQALVAELRAAGEIVDDDVLLVHVGLVDRPSPLAQTAN